MAVKNVRTDENILNYGLRDIAFQKLNDTLDPEEDILILRDVKSLSLDVEEGDAKSIWTNDTIVFSKASEGAVTGSLAVLRFPDEFLIEVLGQERLKDGTLVDGKEKAAFNVFWKVQGDKETEIRAARNVTFGNVLSQEYNTYEGDITERNETVNFTVLGQRVKNDPDGRIQRFVRLTKSGNPELFDEVYTSGLTAPEYVSEGSEA